MNREVVKTDSATTRIPELDFEIPAFTQKGCEYLLHSWGSHINPNGFANLLEEVVWCEFYCTLVYIYFSFSALSTIEGLLDRAVAGLEQDQPIRRVCAGLFIFSFLLVSDLIAVWWSHTNLVTRLPKNQLNFHLLRGRCEKQLIPGLCILILIGTLPISQLPPH